MPLPPLETVEISPDQGTDRNADPRWWESENPGRSLVSVAERIWDAQAERRSMLLKYASLYANQPVPNLYQLGLSKDHHSSLLEYNGHRVSFNVIQSVLDTVHARIAKNYTRGQFITEGGDWETVRRAKLLTQYGEGLQYETDWHDDIGQETFLDALTFDGGCVHIWGCPEYGKPRAKRVLPFEILVDETEAIDANPRHQYRKKYLHRDVILASEVLNPGGRNEGIIRAASGVDPMDSDDGRRTSEMIPVYCGWRLPSAPGRGDGATLVAIPTGALTKVEKYERDYHPNLVFRWKRRRMGFWGDGLVSQLVGLQCELNELLLKAQRCMEFSIPRWFMETTSEIANADINDVEHSILRYRGTPPVMSSPSTVPREIFEHIDRIYSKAFEIAGVSQMSATSQKPAGVQAAIALQTLQDVETQRFVLPAKRWETLNIKGLDRMVDAARDLYAGGQGKDALVRAPGSEFLKRIKWSEVNLDKDVYILRPKPTSIIPESIPGRLQVAHELLQTGAIDQGTFLGLIDHPDTRAALDIQLGEQQHVTRVLDDMLDSGEYSPPEPFQDVGLARKLAANLYFRSQRDDVPDERRQLILMYLSDLQRIEQAQAAAAAPPQPAVPGADQPLQEEPAPDAGLLASAIPAI